MSVQISGDDSFSSLDSFNRLLTDFAIVLSDKLDQPTSLDFHGQPMA